MLFVSIETFFVAWLAATILYQFPPLARALSRIDIFRMLPKWTFFAPNPGQHDLHLLCRDRTREGVLTDWQEAVCIDASLGVPGLWNPEKRVPKVLWDCWASLQHFLAQQSFSPENIQVSGGYLVLLNAALRAPKTSDALERQFTLVRSTGFSHRDIEPIYISYFHLLKTDSRPVSKHVD